MVNIYTLQNAFFQLTAVKYQFLTKLDDPQLQSVDHLAFTRKVISIKGNCQQRHKIVNNCLCRETSNSSLNETPTDLSQHKDTHSHSLP